MTVSTQATAVATHTPTNAAIALVLGAYLAIVLYQGNLGALATAAKQDFLGGGNEQPFWRWAVAVLILVAVADNPTTKPYFGPLLGFALVAMLINIATTQPTLLNNLNSGVKALFGRTGG